MQNIKPEYTFHILFVYTDTPRILNVQIDTCIRGGFDISIK